MKINQNSSRSTEVLEEEFISLTLLLLPLVIEFVLYNVTVKTSQNSELLFVT
jgi:hypothetical protein